MAKMALGEYSRHQVNWTTYQHMTKTPTIERNSKREYKLFI